MAILSNIIKNKRLVGRKNWENYIEGLKSNTTAKNKKQIKKQLKQKLVEAVSKRLPKKRFGLLFSGGVDSSTIALIAKKLRANFICYSVGTGNSKDAAEAKKAAKQLKLRLKYKIFNLKEAERIIKKAAAITGKPDLFNLRVPSF